MPNTYSGVDGLERRLTFRDQDNVPINLASGTLTVRLAASARNDDRLLGRQVVIVDAPNGIAKVVTGDDQLVNDGVYKAQGWLDNGAGVYPSDILEFTV